MYVLIIIILYIFKKLNNNDKKIQIKLNFLRIIIYF